MAKASDIRICSVELSLEEHPYRTPLKFGGVVVANAVLMNVTLEAENGSGSRASGFGSMPLGNAWAFPSQNVTAGQTLEAMKRLGDLMVEATRQVTDAGHPIDLMLPLEDRFLEIAADLTREMGLADPIPKLCTLVTASPIDAALHDAFGKASGINAYNGLDAGTMAHDLAHYLNDDFSGEYLDQYTSREPKPRMPLYHLIAAQFGEGPPILF